ncbi:ABC transporter permease subunit [Streptomyces griseus]
MTTKTTPAGSPLIALPAARHLTTAGAAIALIGTFLAWTWTAEFPGDLTVTGYPGGLQVLTLVGAVLTLLFALSGYGIKGLRWLTPGGANSPVRLAAIGVLGTTGFTVGAIAVKLGGVVNLEPGAWVSLVGAIIATVAALGLPADQELDDTTRPTPLNRFVNSLRAPAPTRAKDLPNWAEILIIAGAFGVALHVFTYGIDTEYAELFIGYIISVAFGFTALTRAGLIARITRLTTKHRNVTLTAALIAAFCFPFTQQNEQYALIGANILIFATVALGLNVVVGLAGLLDLGYVAFLGVGAYAAALVSGSPLSPVGVQFPFWAAVLTGAAASLVFGVVIGAPTLRLRGDYLAIVTLGFARKIVSLGIAHSPEGRHIFPRLTIAENLLLGAYLRNDKAGIEKDVQRAYDLFPILGERRKQAAGTLSGGEQQMLAMGRALMSQPKLLMLDEPSMGLSPIMMQKIMETIVELKAAGTTILLVEQNAQAALSLADQGHVMEVGKIVLSGPGSDLLHDESVRKAYLGED